MCDHEVESMDKAYRPSTVIRLERPTSSARARHPQNQAEIDRRVEIYARQVEEHGRITWLPYRPEEQDA